MPPKRQSKKCELCLRDIKANEDTVVCSGECQATLHRYCAGVTESYYKKFSTTNGADKFTCLQCSQKDSAAKIEALEQALARALAALSSPSKTHHKYFPQPKTCSYANATLSQPNTSARSTRPSQKYPKVIYNPQATPLAAERKFNIVVYGIKERPKGTHMHKRLSDDIKSVSETVHSICPDLSSQSICDSTRIGKYSEERTRPIVARLTRVQDVYKILANKHKLPRSPNNVKSYVSIKPFMTKTERLTESTLLKERRALIESGTDRRDIKTEEILCM